MLRAIEAIAVILTLLAILLGAFQWMGKTYATLPALWVAVTEARIESLEEDLDDDAWRVYELNKAKERGEPIDESRKKYLEDQVDAKIRKVERLEQLQQTLGTGIVSD